MAASLNDLIAARTKVQIGDQSGEIVVLDVSLEENHTGTSTVTDYPVEQGPSISDNSRPQPRVLSIRGAVTGTPIDLGLAYGLPPGKKKLRGKTAWEKLDKWRREGERVFVVTSFFGYVDMVITSIEVPRNAANTDGVEMSISFKQVFTVASKTVTKPSRNVKKAPVEKGKQSTSKANTATGDSVLYTILGK